MQAIIDWIFALDLSAGQIVVIVIFFVYLLVSGIGFALIFLTGQGYMDLARGLRRILDRFRDDNKLEDITGLSSEISKYYDSYAKYNPSIHQRYASIINWMDDILLQTNMFNNSKRKKKKNFGVWFDEYYDTLSAVQQYFESKYPFYRCSSSQSQLLEDITLFQCDTNADTVEKVVRKTEEEFIRLNNEAKKNERVNYSSVAIGVTGILVSVLLTVLQML